VLTWIQNVNTEKLEVFQKEVTMEPPVDLISKVIPPFRFAWRGSNKAVTMSLNWCQSGNIMDTSQVCHASCCGIASHLCTLRFCNSDCFGTFEFVGPVFLYFFQNFPNFCFSLRVRLVLGLPYAFTMFLPSLLHSPYALLSCYKRWSNNVLNLKIHGQFCSHCLFKK